MGLGVELWGVREDCWGGEFVGGGRRGGRGAGEEVGVFGKVKVGVLEGGVGGNFLGRDGGEGGEGGGNKDRLEGRGGKIC